MTYLFALSLRVCFKQYSGSYEDFLSMANLSVLQARIMFLKLCTFYKIYMGYFISSHSLFHRPSLNLRYHHTAMFTPVYACTNLYKYSFFPHCITLWSNLPPEIVIANSVNSFRRALLGRTLELAVTIATWCLLCNVLLYMYIA